MHGGGELLRGQGWRRGWDWWLGSRSGCWAWGEAVTVGVQCARRLCKWGYSARRSSCASTSSRSSRSSCGAPGRWAAVIGRTRASAGAAPCAAWFGARCVGGRCGGYGQEGYRGLHLRLGEELALLHGVDPEDEVILTCNTRSRACSAAPISLCPEPGGRRRTWKMVALVCFWWQGLALPELVQAGHERRKPLFRPEIELRVDGHLVQ